MGTAAQVLKVRGQELVNGNYTVEFKILTASAALQFRLRVLNRVVFVKTVRLPPSRSSSFPSALLPLPLSLTKCQRLVFRTELAKLCPSFGFLSCTTL